MAGILYSSAQDSFKTKSKLTKKVKRALSNEGYSILNESVWPYFPNFVGLEHQLLSQKPVAVVLDLTSPDIVTDPTKFCDHIAEQARRLYGKRAPPIIVIVDTFKRGIQAMLGGAYDYISTEYDCMHSFRDALVNTVNEAVLAIRPELQAA
ncbi:MAG: hypothetical protein NTX24_02885 [Candidatus Pacearchaeota archaeon]|nr:hypothetical protein [Candidatus Pacearchaeota archaeon]